MAVKQTLQQIHRRLKRLDRKKCKRRKAKNEAGLTYDNLEERRVLNAAPVATSDRFYFTDTNANLHVFASNGLLANDFDLEEDSVGVEGGVQKKAKQFTSTEQGGSLLAFDTGEFIYIPPVDFVGVDAFYYQAEDGELLSKQATVNVAVGTGLSAQLNVADYSVDNLLHSGVLQTTQSLGGGLELNYRSDSVPTPIIAVETFLLPGTPNPDSISVTSEIGGVTGDTTEYNTDNLDPSEALRFVQRVLAPELATGLHDWTMTITLHYDGAADLVQEFTGQQVVINRTDSEFGVGWWLSSYDRIVPGGDGALLVNSDGHSLYFELGDNGYLPADGDQTYSTLVDHGNGFTLTDKWGDSREFDTSRRIIAVKRLNNNVDEFTFDYDDVADRLQTITDQFGRTWDFSYDSNGNLQSVNDFADRDTTVSIDSGGLLTQVIVADEPATANYPDYVAPEWNFGYVKIGGYQYLDSITDPESATTTYDYKLATRRLRSITAADQSRLLLRPGLTQGFAGEGTYDVFASSRANGRFGIQGKTYNFKTDSVGNTTQIVDRFGDGIDLAYDLNGNLVTQSQVFSNVVDSNSASDYGYSEAGNLVLIIGGADGSIQTGVYNSDTNNLASWTKEFLDPTENTTQILDYDEFGNLIQFQDEEGGVKNFQYDIHGNIAEEISDPDGVGPIAAVTTSYGYDGTIYNLPTTIQVGDESTSQLVYNSLDLPVSVVSSLGVEFYFAYAPDGTVSGVSGMGPGTESPPEFGIPFELFTTSAVYTSIDTFDGGGGVIEPHGTTIAPGPPFDICEYISGLLQEIDGEVVRFHFFCPDEPGGPTLPPQPPFDPSDDDDDLTPGICFYDDNGILNCLHDLVLGGGVIIVHVPPTTGGGGGGEDENVLTFSTDAASIEEGEAITVTVNLDRVNSQVVAAGLDATGVAGLGSDYSLDYSSLDFGTNETQKVITIVAAADNEDEGDEPFLLSLSGTNAIVGTPGSINGTITDGTLNDGLPVIRFFNTSGSGEEGNSIEVVVGLDKAPASDQPVTASIIIAGGNAISPADYTFSPSAVSFDSNDYEPRTITVTLIDDNDIEGIELFGLGIADVVNADLAEDGSAVFAGTILDNDNDDNGGDGGPDGLPDDISVSFLDFERTATEGELYPVRLRLSNPSPVPITVEITNHDFTAVLDTDYSLSTTTVEFAEFQQDATVFVTLEEDEEDEPTERFALQISSVTSGVSLGNSIFQGSIEDGGPLVAIYDVDNGDELIDDGTGELDFGTVDKDEEAKRHLRIKNNGDQDLHLLFSSIQLPEKYKLVDESLGTETISPDQEFEFELELITEDRGEFIGEFQLPTSLAAELALLNFTLSGKVAYNSPPKAKLLPVVQIIEDFDTNDDGIYTGLNVFDFFSDIDDETGTFVYGDQLEYTITLIDKSDIIDQLNNDAEPLSQSDTTPPDELIHDNLSPLAIDPVISATVNADGFLEFDLTKDAFGFSQLIISATDEDGAATATTVFVDVNPIDDAPALRGGVTTYGDVSPTDDTVVVSTQGSFQGSGGYGYITHSERIVDLWQIFEDAEDGNYLSFSVSTDNSNLFDEAPNIPTASNSGPSDGILRWRWGHDPGSTVVRVTATDSDMDSLTVAFTIGGVADYHDWYNARYDGWYNGFNDYWGGYWNNYDPNGDGDFQQPSWAGSDSWETHSQFLEIGGTNIDAEYVELNNGYGEGNTVERRFDEVTPDGQDRAISQITAQYNLERDRDLKNTYTEFSPVDSLTFGWDVDQDGECIECAFDQEDWLYEWAENSNVVGKPAVVAYGWGFGNHSYYYGSQGGTVKFNFDATTTKIWAPASLLYSDGNAFHDSVHSDHFENEHQNQFGYRWHGYGWGGGYGGYGWNGGYNGALGFGGGGELREVQPGVEYNLPGWGGWGYGGYGRGYGGHYYGGGFGAWGSNGDRWWPGNSLSLWIEGIEENAQNTLEADFSLERHNHWVTGPSGEYEYHSETISGNTSASLSYVVGNFAAGFTQPDNCMAFEGCGGPDTDVKTANLTVNSIDTDNDAVPDFLDGYDADSQNPLDDVSSSDDLQLREIVVVIPKQVNNDATLRLSFNDFLSDELGTVRLWTTNDASRDIDYVDQSSDGEQLRSGYEYTFADLGLCEQDCMDDRILRLYVEALSPGQSEIEIFLDARGHGPQLRDVLTVNNRSQISVSAVDAFGQEGGDDNATFRISRTNFPGNSAPLNVFFRVDFPEWDYQYAGNPNFANAATPPLRENRDFSLSSDSTFFFDDAHNLIGVIEVAGDYADISIDILDDNLVEWDQEVTIELLTREEVIGLTLIPESSLLVNSLYSAAPTFISQTQGDNFAKPFTEFFDSAYYQFEVDFMENPVNNTATAYILDNDGYESETRTSDYESTGELPSALSVQYATVDQEDGSVNLNLPLNPRIPQYNSDDNLVPVFVLTSQVPRFEEAEDGPDDVQTPTGISASITIAGIEIEQNHVFDVANLEQLLVDDPDTELRFVVAADSEEFAKLPTGTYEYSVKFEFQFAGGATVNRTVRGTTEVINRVNSENGDAEFGQRFTLNELDRLYFTSGQVIPDGDAQFNTHESYSSQLVRQGANPFSGITLVRGDNSSVFFELDRRTGAASYDFDSGEFQSSQSPTFNNWQQQPDGSYLVANATGVFVKWAFPDLEPTKVYRVGVNWVAGVDRTEFARYEVRNATAIGGNSAEGFNESYLVDQRYQPSGDFLELGLFVPNEGGSLEVSLAPGTFGYTSFDGILVQEVSWNNALQSASIGPIDGYFSELKSEENDDWNGGETTEFVIQSPYSGNQYYFDNFGLLIYTEDRNGNLTHYEYDAADDQGIKDDLVRITDQGGLAYEYAYDDSGYLESVTDPTGLVTSFTITDGRVTTIALPDTGFNSESEDQSYSFDYQPADDDYRLNKITDGENHRTLFNYGDKFGFKTAIENPDGGDWTITSEQGFVFDDLMASNPDLFLNDDLSFDGIGILLAEELGRILNLDDEESDDDLPESRSIVKDARGNYSTWQTDHFGNLTAYVDELQENKWIYERNEHGQLLKYIEPGFNITQFADETNTPSVEFIESKQTVYTYNGDHLLESITYAFESENPLFESWTYQQVDVESAGFGFWTIDEQTATDGKITKYQFNSGSTSVSQIIENYNGSGLSRTTFFTSYTANPDDEIDLIPGGLLKESTLDGQTTSIQYYEEPFSSEEDGDKRIGLIQSQTVSGNGVSQTTTFDYDQYRYPSSLIAPGDVETIYEYDRLGQLIFVTYAAQSNVALNGGNISFDGNGFPIANPENIGQTIEYNYDAAGNRDAVIEQRDSQTFIQTNYTYDNLNRLETVSLPFDASAPGTEVEYVKYTYDDNGNLLKERLYGDAERTTAYIYDEQNLLTQEIRPRPFFGPVPGTVPIESERLPNVYYQYDTNGNLLKVTDARYLDDNASDSAINNAIGTNYFYDIHGRLVATKQGSTSNDLISRIVYDNAGRVVQDIQQFGLGDTNFAVTGFAYDDLGRRHKEFAPADNNGVSKTTQYNYDLRNNVTQILVTAGDISTAESRHYDSLDRLIGIDHINPVPGQDGLKSIFAYDESGYLAVELVLRGNLESITSSSIANVTTAARNESAAGNHVRLTRYLNDGRGNVVAIVSPDRGGEDILTDSSSGFFSEPDQSVISVFEYDLSGNQTQSAIVYLDRVPELETGTDTDSMGSGGSSGSSGSPITSNIKVLITNTAFDLLNRTIEVLSPVNEQGYRDSFVTQYNIDSTVDNTTQTIWKPATGQNGSWTQTTAVTDYQYDSTGRLYRTQLPAVANSIRPTSYVFQDANGNVVKTVDVEGLESIRQHDELNRLTSATRPIDQTTEVQYYEYFADGLLKETHTLHGSSVTPFDPKSYVYDAVGNLIRQTDSAGTISYLRDGLGLIESVQDRAGQTTEFKFDVFGRILEETLDTDEIQLSPRVWDYDAFGNLVQYTNRNSEVISYGYDHVGNRIGELWVGGDYQATFDYNPLGQLISASDQITSFGITYTNSSYVYDYLNDSDLGTVSRFLNPSVVHNGDLQAESNFAQTFRTEYLYDTRGLTASVNLSVLKDGEFNDLFENDYVFDALGRTQYAQQVIGSDTKSVDLGYVGSRLTTIGRTQNSGLVGTTLYVYRADGRLQSLIHDARVSGVNTGSDSLDLIYDAQGRITFGSWEYQAEAFDYDAVGATLEFTETYGRDYVFHETAEPAEGATPDAEVLATDNEGNVTHFKRFSKPTPYIVRSEYGTFGNAYFTFNDIDGQNFQIHAGIYKFRFDNDGSIFAGGNSDTRMASFHVADFGNDTDIGVPFEVSLNDDVWEFEFTFDQNYGGSDGELYLYIDLQTNDEINPNNNNTFEIRALEEFQLDWDYQNRISEIVKTTAFADGNTYELRNETITYHYDVLGDLIGIRRSQEGNNGYDWKFFVPENGQNAAAYTFDHTPGNSDQFQFVATSFNGLSGEQFAATNYLADGGNASQANPHQTYWLYQDQQGNLSHTRNPSSGELNRAKTTITGETLYFDNAVNDSISSVVRGFTDYYYDRSADVSLRGNRLFDSVSKRFLNEGQGEAIRGIGDLYVRGGIAPIGNAPPVHSSTTGFFAGGYVRSQFVENIHTGLSTLGLIPGAGIFFDGADSALYALEGDYTNATISGTAAIPLLGYGAYAARAVTKTAKFAAVVDNATMAGRYAFNTTSNLAGRTFNSVADLASDSFTALGNVSRRSVFTNMGLGQGTELFSEIARLRSVRGALNQQIVSRQGIVGIAGGQIRGFRNAGEVSERAGNLANRLRAAGLDDVRVGIRGSAVTGEARKGGSFRLFGNKRSDVDFFFSSQKLEAQIDRIGGGQNLFVNGRLRSQELNKLRPGLQSILDDFGLQTSNQLGRNASGLLLRNNLVNSFSPANGILLR